MDAELQGARVLLLQGPNGPFFRRLAEELQQLGAEVRKINFNAGDQFYFSGPQAKSFRGRLQEWPAYLRRELEELNPKYCFLFGDCRPLHKEARPLLDEFDVETFVFEEGYLRPDYVTIERAGVNSRSALRLSPPDLDRGVQEPAPTITPVRNPFRWCVLHTCIYSLCLTLGKLPYRNYRHHRDLNSFRQAYLWALSGVRRYTRARANRSDFERIKGELSGRYFLAGLQVHNDSQIASSSFENVEEFIRLVLCSFAEHSQRQDSLVFKHHPGDRAYRDYTRFIEQLTEEQGVKGRIYYVHDLHLPTLLTHAKGTVVINSTIGWSSLHHRTPVLALDETTYGYLGLNAKVPLDEFWQAPPTVDTPRVKAAERWLKLHNQANGSFWKPLAGTGPSGLFWPPRFKLEPAKKTRRQSGRQKSA